MSDVSASVDASASAAIESANNGVVRDEKGRWLPGKAPRTTTGGNPIHKRMMRMRTAIMKAHTPEDAAEAVRALHGLMCGTDVKGKPVSHRDQIAAARVWLDYVVGKPGDMDKARESTGNNFIFVFGEKAEEARRAVENLKRGSS